MIRVITFPFRVAWWLFKWTMIGLICFIVGMNLGR